MMLTVAGVGLRRFLRERSNIFFMFVFPLLIIFLIGVGFGSEAASTLGVAGADTEAGRSVVAHLPAERVEIYGDAEAARRAVEQSEIAAAAFFSDGEDEPIRFLARAGVGLDARADLERAVAAENQRIAIARQAALAGVAAADVEQVLTLVPATEVETERVGDEMWAGLSNYDASSLTQVVLFTFLSALTASAFLIQDRDLGMARRKASAPISVNRLVMGETLGRFWIAAFQTTFIVAATAIAFGVAWGNLLATGVILVLFALVATGAAVFLGSAMNNAEAATGIGIMLGLVLAALGGAMAPVEIFPPFMQTVARLTPHYWAIEGLKISVAGGGLDEIGRPLAVLAAVAFGLVALAAWFYRRTVFANR